jgi:DNA polymerase-3 subunit epsilon
LRLILPFDVETNGMPEWGIPSEDPKQPHIVQLAAMLVDELNGKVMNTMDVIVKPKGWDITPEMTEIHGISFEQAMDEGIPEEDALDQFMDMYIQCSLRIAHNTTFDNRIIRIALKRYRPDLVSDEEWKDKTKYFCTYQKAKKVMGDKDGHTLGECYKYFTGKDMENAHSAMPDIKACLEVYHGIQALRGENDV